MAPPYAPCAFAVAAHGPAKGRHLHADNAHSFGGSNGGCNGGGDNDGNGNDGDNSDDASNANSVVIALS